MFSRKKEMLPGLPDLPPIQRPFLRQDVDDEQVERHALPSFPDSPTHNSFSQAAIKEAVSPRDNLPALPDNSNVKVVEMQEWNPSPLPDFSGEETTQLPEAQNFQREFHSPMTMSAPPQMMPSQFQQVQMPERYSPQQFSPQPMKPGVDVFVKIDKFHAAKKTLKEVGSSLEEIDNLIKKIREIKLREEQEISNWERDVLHAKTRIQEISENIFEKI